MPNLCAEIVLFSIGGLSPHRRYAVVRAAVTTISMAQGSSRLIAGISMRMPPKVAKPIYGSDRLGSRLIVSS